MPIIDSNIGEPRKLALEMVQRTLWCYTVPPDDFLSKCCHIRQVWAIRERWQTRRSNDGLNFFLSFLLNLRVADHSKYENGQCCNRLQ